MHTIILDQDVKHFFMFFFFSNQIKLTVEIKCFCGHQRITYTKTLLVSSSLYKCPISDGLIDVLLDLFSIDCLYDDDSLYQLKCMVKRK